MDSKQYEQKLKEHIKRLSIQAEHMRFKLSCHTVEEACTAAHAEPTDFVKSVVMVGIHGTVVAVVRGDHRASTERVGRVLGIPRPRIATPEEVLERTGYPAGGTPCFGYPAQFVIDPAVLEKEYVYTGGGSDHALVRILVSEIQKLNGGKITRVRK